MTREELLTLFEKVGALQAGHFQLTSGLHSAQYIQCAAVFEYPKTAGKIVKQLVGQLPKGVDTVIAPAIGGINLGYEVARSLGCRFVFTERENGLMALRRGFALKPQERVLVVEDVVTTGGSVKEVLDIARQHNCTILGVASLVDRSQGKADFEVPFVSLLSMRIETYRPEECPLSTAGQPITKPGSRSSSGLQ